MKKCQVKETAGIKLWHSGRVGTFIQHWNIPRGWGRGCMGGRGAGDERGAGRGTSGQIVKCLEPHTKMFGLDLLSTFWGGL